VRPCHSHPVVHLELHTGDLPCASAFYSRLLRWRTERIDAGVSSYLALEFGGGFGGGIVECGTRRPVWLPYVRVDRVDELTERARGLGASVLLEPREARRAGAASSRPPSAGRSRSGSRGEPHELARPRVDGR
jgi:uncharacterized protein